MPVVSQGFPMQIFVRLSSTAGTCIYSNEGDGQPREVRKNGCNHSVNLYDGILRYCCLLVDKVSGGFSSFNFHSRLIFHKREITDDKMGGAAATHSCRLCPESFPNEFALRRHFNDHRVCWICGMECKSVFGVIRHEYVGMSAVP